MKKIFCVLILFFTNIISTNEANALATTSCSLTMAQCNACCRGGCMIAYNDANGNPCAECAGGGCGVDPIMGFDDTGFGDDPTPPSGGGSGGSSGGGSGGGSSSGSSCGSYEIRIPGGTTCLYTGQAYSGSTCCRCTTSTCCHMYGTACNNCTSGYCQGCSAGYKYISSGKYCERCPAGTYSNSGATSCTPCPVGKYSTSAGSSSCTSCPSGQTTDSTGSTSSSQCHVIACNVAHCSTCEQGLSNSCQTCQSGYYKYSAGSSSSGSAGNRWGCKACSEIAVSHGTCTACSATGSCTAVSCDSGYHASGTSCVADGVSCPSDFFLSSSCPTGCPTLATGCAFCQTSGTGSGSSGSSSFYYCTSCKDGYRLGTKGNCIAIVPIDHCLADDGHGKCVRCEDGYYASDDQTQCLSCIAKHGNCCMECTKNSCNVYGNQNGYMMQGSSCVVETDGCERDSSVTSCYRGWKCNGKITNENYSGFSKRCENFKVFSSAYGHANIGYCTTCKPNYKLNSCNDCEWDGCPAGKYTVVGSGNNPNTCQTCSGSTYQPNNKYSGSSCTPCPAGTSPNAEHTACVSSACNEVANAFECATVCEDGICCDNKDEFGKCIGPDCYPGYVYNTLTGQCDKQDDPCPANYTQQGCCCVPSEN
ncbi:MAG: hypothetical protein MJ247_05935 [Alphaproteobacteria bacterium]|nr:hypothetical protein [Alphaproteobacteria bacterium]